MSFSTEANLERLLYRLLVKYKLPCQRKDGDESFHCGHYQMMEAIEGHVQKLLFVLQMTSSLLIWKGIQRL